MDSFQEAAMRMAGVDDGAHANEVQEDDSGASEADLLCSEVLSESHDEGSDVGSDGLYRRRYNYHAAQVSAAAMRSTCAGSFCAGAGLHFDVLSNCDTNQRTGFVSELVKPSQAWRCDQHDLLHTLLLCNTTHSSPVKRRLLT